MSSKQDNFETSTVGVKSVKSEISNESSSEAEVKFNKDIFTNTNNKLDNSERLEFQEIYKGKYEIIPSKIIKLQVPIIESFNLNLLNNFKYYTTRFYTDKYSVDFQNVNKEAKEVFHDVLVRIHTNGVLLIALAPGNSIMNSSKEITEINFKVNNTDRSNIAIRGKRKMGAKFVKKETVLCQVKLEDNPGFYNIRAGVQGLLVEFNEIIKTNPNILKTDPKGMGYVCMILPKAPQDRLPDAINNFNLLNEEAYFDYLSTR